MGAGANRTRVNGRRSNAIAEEGITQLGIIRRYTYIYISGDQET